MNKSLLSFLLLALSLGLPNLRADDVYARIRGNVTDATGAAVPGVTIKAVNTATQVTKEITSSDTGSFEFLNLQPGTYDVSATKTGFASVTTRNLTLAINQIYEMNLSLEVGQVNQTVEVEANPAQVETTNTQLGSVINSQQITGLPVLNRNWINLQQIQPGVVGSSDRFSNNYATNGSQSQQNSFLINGTDSNDLPLNTPLIIPSEDGIQEFDYVTSTINPEYGRNSGGILNATFKSGTNSIHGDAFEFYRDTFLNGRNFFQKGNPVFHQNQFGGTVGAPIIKDKTFIFLSYQGTRSRQPQGGPQDVTVFTPDQRNGVFPDIATSTAASPIPLVGENGATYAAGTPYNVLFPTGHIPAADINSISKKYLSYVPLPNLGSSQYSFTPITILEQNQGYFRFDHTFSTRDAVWGTGFFENTPSTDDLPFTGSSLPGFGEIAKRSYKQGTAAWNHTFSPTTLNEFRVALTRFNFVAVDPQTPALPSSFGFTGINPQDAAGAGAPYVGITGYFNLGFSTNGPQPRIDSTYQLTDNFSKIVGNHSLKFGFEGRRFQVNNPFFGNNNGNFTFGGNGLYSTGDPGADFLLGIPDSYLQGSGGYIDARAYEFYFYAQDSYKVNKNLTVNYGLGYQTDTPLVNQHFGKEAFNCFRPGQQSTIFPTAPLGLDFPGDTGCSASGYYSHWDHVDPRFGFAYAPDWGPLSGGAKKFVIRGGFGVYDNRSEEELVLQNLGAVPFSQSSTGISDVGGNPSFAAPFTDIATGQSIPNKFPFTPATKGSNVNFSQFYPLSINTIDPHFTEPYSFNYNLNIQRELPGAMILQIGYVGSAGRHLEMAYEGNPITPAGQAACAADKTCIANRLFQHYFYPTHSYVDGSIFSSVGTQATVGNSNYNSLQVSLNKRFSRGLYFLLAYTYSHSLDDASSFENSSFGARGTNPYNFRLNYGDSAFDARHRFVGTYSYDLPNLHNRMNALPSLIFGGWTFTGITTLQTGFPITIADTGFRSLFCDALSYYGCPDTANVLGTVNTYDPRSTGFVNKTLNPNNTHSLTNNWFNPNIFARAPYGVFGNAGRNFFHGPGIEDTDLSLIKVLKFTENYRIEMRMDSFNVFNHTQFNSPTSNIASGNFGGVFGAAAGRIVQLAARVYF